MTYAKNISGVFAGLYSSRKALALASVGVVSLCLDPRVTSFHSRQTCRSIYGDFNVAQVLLVIQRTKVYDFNLGIYICYSMPP